MIDALLQSPIASVGTWFGLIALAAGVMLVGALVVRWTWRCRCGRTIDVENQALSMGTIFQCAGCGESHIVRPHASFIGWILMLAAVGAALWGSGYLLDWQVTYADRWIDALLQVGVSAGKSPNLFGFAIIIMALAAFYQVFWVERDPDPDNRPKV